MDKGLIQDFKKFILRGNVVDLAVGVIIGAAFGSVVKSMVEDIITPMFGLLGGQPDFSGLAIPGTNIMVGKLINAVLSFLIQAAVIFLVVVLPMNKLVEKLKARDPETKPLIPEDIRLLTEIRDLLKAKS
jgi:large conductance mechanosensitive channel